MEEATLITARKVAEKAVSDMPDGELKTKAFEVIFRQLLSDSGAGTPPESPVRDRKPRPTPAEKHTKNFNRPPRSMSERILLLKDEGFFKDQRSISAVRDELRAHGWVYPLTSLSGILQSLVQKRTLRRALISSGKKRSYRYVDP